MTELKKTALNGVHRRLGGRMVEFGGWDMPVQYSGTIDEHLAVRTAAGIFDVSHMGEIEIRGPQALEFVQHLTPNNAAKLADGQAQYSALLYPEGTFVDDILVHRFGPEHFFICVNASNADKDFAWTSDHVNGFDVEALNTSDQYTQLAIQGPKALAILQPFADVDLGAIKYYWFTRGHVDDVPAIIARTGYTGEDGFEIYFDPGESERIWNKVLEAGRPHGMLPCGLAARNTLRLEAKMALYGHEIDNTTTAYEADLGWIVKLDKGDFIGRERLAAQKAEGVKRKLVGFEMIERGIGRDGYPVFLAGGAEPVGHVTSGSPAPFLHKNIGLTYLPVDQAAIGTRFDIEIRGRRVAAEVVPTPFYKRSK
ncbi:MAG TPA: glycine cleavage system aminomethyltransferase GcvT [Blastocatellia bacterium]|nr:glycine cleavage system aminomethyltransferase GcvT [Blastocatellia bacterium]